MLKEIISIYLIWNFITLIVMGIDKIKARGNRWRIAEKILLGLGFFMGAVGIFAGMHLFRHKTQHIKFTVGIPILIGFNLLVCLAVLHYGNYLP